MVVPRPIAPLPNFALIHAHRKEDTLRTEPVSRGRGHGTVDAELAGLVAGGRHHATLLGRAADDHGLAGKGRVVPDLDRGIESVHVDVDDHGSTSRLLMSTHSRSSMVRSLETCS